ncbi:hypothetical protein FHG87_006276 [Trinorchestia longiramus]|nr:hypothetical protein FHG87_006276 [Trinorchestia longiramus]
MVTFDLLSTYTDFIARLKSKDLQHQNLMKETIASVSTSSTNTARDEDKLSVSGTPAKLLPTKELDSSKQSISEKWKQDLESELVHLEGLSGEIREQVDHLMTLMGWPTLLRTVYDTISTSLSLYYVIDCMINQLPGLFNNLGLLMWRIFGFFLLATNTDEFNIEREKSSNKLKKMVYTSPVLQSSKKATKALKELEKPVLFSLASFAALNRGMFASMCGFAVSYTVVAVQFRLSGIDGRTPIEG